MASPDITPLLTRLHHRYNYSPDAPLQADSPVFSLQLVRGFRQLGVWVRFVWTADMAVPSQSFRMPNDA